MSIGLSEQEILRREALQQLRQLGIEPYPAASYNVNVTARDIKENYERDKTSYKNISFAGRIMTRRIMGSASFAELQDSTGRIQVYIKRDDICPGEDKTFYNTVFKKLLDIGDYVGVKGFVFTTQTGEISVHVTELTLLAKSLKPLPVVKRDEQGNIFDGFTDPELRYRQRYVDLTVNPELKQIFINRSKVINTMRNYFDSQGWMEVETPILQPIHGGAAARPFKTHHNTLDMPLYLRIANELYLKRLIVAGFDGVYEFGKMFRNEGMDRTHNPEFTSMEIYVAYKDYIWMMSMVEECLEKIALAIHGTSVVKVAEHLIDFAGPYEKLSMFGSIQKYTGIDVSQMDEPMLRQVCRDLDIEVDKSMGKGKLVDEIFSAKVEANLIQPTFITDYPVEMTPLAKKHRSIEGLVERFEIFVNGKEIGNAYSELNDPIDQRGRFEDQLALADRGDEEAMAMDEDFLRALEYGMPPTSGLGFGIDRLVMLMTNQSTIQEVLFFPQMRPEKRLKVASVDDFVAIGVPVEWVPVLLKMGFNTIEELKAGNPNKVFNDLGGMRKKLKLEITMPSKEEVMLWFE
ncbi:lysyl-tRNA synthetase class II [Arcticibacter tournemirensis]|uniref:Lysine--tRNA ligase n=1 Tax=Arcticibacter tournemirensis TaxID=699437 RepID=A0A5M9H4G4_9SPHI|nr:lysine--tRNA ligase [Arcticibacter tournemirensis]KAA8481822.1 lysine--tRNA ligase [Arcticibacter tournemirensis]TQM50142.1 lysyl-tRNA synthetase class II [Arcticibacter tournemirensis]